MHSDKLGSKDQILETISSIEAAKEIFGDYFFAEKNNRLLSSFS